VYISNPHSEDDVADAAGSVSRAELWRAVSNVLWHVTRVSEPTETVFNSSIVNWTSLEEKLLSKLKPTLGCKAD
jgi:hypothetical protein